MLFTSKPKDSANSALQNKIRYASCIGSTGDLVLNLLLQLIVRNARVLLIFKTDDKIIVSYIYLPSFENSTEYTVHVILQAIYYGMN